MAPQHGGVEAFGKLELVSAASWNSLRDNILFALFGVFFLTPWPWALCRVHFQHYKEYSEEHSDDTVYLLKMRGIRVTTTLSVYSG
jgi:hypothetical protein